MRRRRESGRRGATARRRRTAGLRNARWRRARSDETRDDAQAGDELLTDDAGRAEHADFECHASESAILDTLDRRRSRASATTRHLCTTKFFDSVQRTWRYSHVMSRPRRSGRGGVGHRPRGRTAWPSSAMRWSAARPSRPCRDAGGAVMGGIGLVAAVVGAIAADGRALAGRLAGAAGVALVVGRADDAAQGRAGRRCR